MSLAMAFPEVQTKTHPFFIIVESNYFEIKIWEAAVCIMLNRARAQLTFPPVFTLSCAKLTS